METGKSSHRICEINNRHKSAVELHKQGPSTVIILTDKKQWTIESQSQQGIKYIVQKQRDSCDCQLLCKECKVCTHMYSCTCLDSILHSTVGKHIHLVIMSTTVGYASTINGSLKLTTGNCDPIYTYFSKVLSQANEQSNLFKLKDTLCSMTQEIHTLISQSSDLGALQSAKTHFPATITTIRALQDLDNTKRMPSPKKRKISPNANHKKQAQFFSKKKNASKNPI